MDLRITGKTVVITGASAGIGFACAQGFAQEGCKITLVSSTEQKLKEAARRLKAEHGTQPEIYPTDLSDASALASLASRVCAADILVNNAGSIPGGGLEEVDDAKWRASWELKLFGYINLCRLALPAMISRRSGVVLNIIGIAGAAPRYDYLCGSTANAALIAFTKAVGAHSAVDGVRVLGLNPGPTQTERLVKLYKSRAAARFGDESRWSELLTHLPFGRPTHAEEIADLAVYLTSERASYLSGVVIDADGGALYGSA